MMGAVVGKGLTLKTDQAHAQRYLEPLMRKIEEGQKKDGCLKMVISPYAGSTKWRGERGARRGRPKIR